VVSALASINEVNLRRARLVLRWATMFGFNSQCRTLISVCKQPATQGQLSLPSLRGQEMSTSFGWEGKGRYGTCYYRRSCHCCHCRLSSVHWKQNGFADRTTTHTSGNSSIDTSLICDIYCGPQVMFQTCVTMKFVDDDDDDSVSGHMRGVKVKLENMCHTWVPYRCNHDKVLYKSMFTFTFDV